MQLGHLAVGLSIATYDWSLGNAAFCLGMHNLPNADALVVKAGLDRAVIRGASRLESFVRRDPELRHPSYRPEADPFWVEMGGFHCTLTHSVFYAVLVSLVVSAFSLPHGVMAFAALTAHYAADIGSTVGLPLLWPFSRRKFTLALFRDTGWWGKDMILGYYRQPMAWVLEVAVFAFLAYRYTVI